MDKFRIFETNQFSKDLKQDFAGQGKRIKTKLTTYVYPQLKQNPYFGKNIKKLTHAPESHACKGVDEWLSVRGFAPRRNPEKSEATAVRPWSFTNYKPETWRYRIGSYRFFYEIDKKKKIIFMIAADNRGNAY